MGEIHKLERLLRENGIAPTGSRDLGHCLAEMIGQCVTISCYNDEGMGYQPCRVLDADETWALLLFKEGKKREHKKLIRLEDVKEIKVEK